MSVRIKAERTTLGLLAFSLLDSLLLIKGLGDEVENSNLSNDISYMNNLRDVIKVWYLMKARNLPTRIPGEIVKRCGMIITGKSPPLHPYP